MHFQPPIDTPAMITKRAAVMEPTATLEQALNWAESLKSECGGKSYTMIACLEITKTFFPCDDNE